MRSHDAARVLALAGAVVLCCAVPAAAGGAPTTQRVSLRPDGSQFAQGSRYFATPSVAADGRLVAFVGSDDLVYVRDRAAGTTVLAGRDGAGRPVTGYAAVLSADGDTLAWATLSGDAWVRDLRRDRATRVRGLSGLALSADGRVVAGTRQQGGRLQVIAVDLPSGNQEIVSASAPGVGARGNSGGASLSADGRLVAFSSGAPDLPEAAPVDGRDDVFVLDRRTHRVERLTGRDRSVRFPFRARLSGDGSTVAMLAERGGTPMCLVLDRATGRAQRVDVSSAGAPGNGLGEATPAPSYDGRTVAFDSYATNLVPGDTNGTSDVFVRDLRRGTTTRVSVRPGGAQARGFSAGPALSADGRTAAWFAFPPLVLGDTNGSTDVYVRAPLPG